MNTAEPQAQPELGQQVAVGSGQALIALTLFTEMSTWHRGRQIVTERREALEGALRHSSTIVAVETAPIPVVAADQVATADDLG